MNDSQKTETFISIADKYIKWVDTPPEAVEFEAATALSLLAALYSAALNIMKLDIEEDGSHVESEENSVSVDQWKEAYERISNFPFNYYYEVDSAHEPSCESHYTDLIEDLTDIYQDVKEGMNLYEKNYKSQALYHWQMTFEFHWGRHILGAMKALHGHFQENSDFEVFQKIN